MESDSPKDNDRLCEHARRKSEGTATGLSKKDVQRISRALHTFCAEETDPVMLDLMSTKVMAADAGGYLLRTTVLPGEDRPYAFKGQRYTGGAYVRGDGHRRRTP